jgi:histidinol-phosphate aminotransferase
MRRRHFLRTGLAAAASAALVPGSRGLGAITAPAPAPTGRRLVDGPIRLNSNENALGPCEAARRAMIDGLEVANRYTHPIVARLRPRLAAHHDVSESSVVLGNGSTEVLQMAVQAMAGPDAAGAGWGNASSGRARLVVADPTFEHVESYTEPWDLELVKVPLTSTHAHDLARMRDAVRRARRQGRPALAYICNPNNPTGSLTPSGEVEAWIREEDDVVFLVDEAYYEYVDHPTYRSALPLALDRPNVIVVRTFSKVYALAGLRIGYALAHPDTARRIGAFSANSNLNAMGLLAALASLDDPDHVGRSLRANAEARRITVDVLDELGLERIPSHTNFVMHEIRGPLRDYIRRMREHGVWVGRPFPPMLGYNRLSFGLPEQMARFADVLREFRREGWI